MTIEGRTSDARVIICEPECFPSATHKPSVDKTFEYVTQVYSGNVLVIILTGVGVELSIIRLPLTIMYQVWSFAW